MKRVGTRIFFVIFGVLFIVGCRNNPITNASSTETSSTVTSQTALSNADKEILINDGRYDRPYEILGQVEYTLEKPSSSNNQIQLRTEGIDLLKKEALTKYGDKVDAIIDTKIQESKEEGYDNPLSITHVDGIAISFKPEEKVVAGHKTKHRAKSSKKILRKTKPQEIKITPSEILK
jgi:hypothetical protein